MGRKYLDEFIKEPVDKMASSISDMTYLYENTRVPKEHYKKQLQKELMDLASSDMNVEMNLLKPYLDMISSMIKENEKFFFKALLMSQAKITYSKLQTLQVEALEFSWNEYKQSKDNMMNDKIINNYNDYIKGEFETAVEIEIDNSLKN